MKLYTIKDNMTQQQILQKMQEHGLVEWRYVRNNRLSQTAGRCKRYSRVIELAGWFLDNNTMEGKVLK